MQHTVIKQGAAQTNEICASQWKNALLGKHISSLPDEYCQIEIK